MSDQRWAVIGGGMLGLGAAHLLQGEGRQVTVLESADHMGGLAVPWEVGTIRWDRHYHVISPADHTLLGLLNELGLESEVKWSPTRTGAFIGGRLYPATSTFDFLRLPGLGLIDKLRIGLTVLRASRVKDVRSLESVPIRPWLVKRSGERAYTNFWEPLLKAKLGEAHRTASAAFIVAIMRRLYEARRAGMKQEMFGYVSGGYATILDRLVRRLRADGVNLLTATAVRAVEPSERAVTVTTADGTSFEFDRVVLTVAPQLAARMLPSLAPQAREGLMSIDYIGVVCASLVATAPITNCYVTNLIDPAPFTGIIEMSSLVDETELDAKTLVYLPRYAVADDPIFQMEDDEIRRQFMGSIEAMFPAFDPASVEAFRVSKAPYVLPRPTLEYSSKVPEVRTSLPGVLMASSANIVNGTLNVNEVLELAESLVEKALEAKWDDMSKVASS
ncbi:MAG TPA: FAD-dependent oxidoreductase [Acidimicrobiia bacterium]|jgi:protoporphyrinogen oxidase